jgi:hypothetical protein
VIRRCSGRGKRLEGVGKWETDEKETLTNWEIEVWGTVAKSTLSKAGESNRRNEVRWQEARRREEGKQALSLANARRFFPKPFEPLHAR